jgi:AcrR family transcriptional regulator
MYMVHDVSVPPSTSSQDAAGGAAPAERLSRGLVISAATTIARRDGLEALSMRRLAEELGVSTMAAYRHVAGKDTLVDDVLEHALGGMELSLPGGAWPDQIVELAERSYAVLLEFPGLAENLHGRALSRPGVVRWLEALNTPLANAGIGPEQRGGFVAGLTWLLRGGARLDAEWFQVVQALEQVSAESTEDTPVMRTGRDELGDDEPVDVFRQSVLLLVDGLAARVGEPLATR